MSKNITDLVLRQLDDVEAAALRGAYNVYDMAQRLKLIRDFRIVEHAIAWAASEDEKLKRLGVEALDYREEFEDAEIDSLESQTNHENPEIRNWATFYLGVQCEFDSERVREILFVRTSDTHDETRDEALVALEKRKDTRVFELISAELDSDDVGLLAVEAAEELGDPRFLPSLLSLETWWDVDGDRLANAIRACSPTE